MKKFIFLLAIIFIPNNSFATERLDCEQYIINNPEKYNECVKEVMKNGDKAVENQKRINNQNGALLGH